jgi:hypothetical protein
MDMSLPTTVRRCSNVSKVCSGRSRDALLKQMSLVMVARCINCLAQPDKWAPATVVLGISPSRALANDLASVLTGRSKSPKFEDLVFLAKLREIALPSQDVRRRIG